MKLEKLTPKLKKKYTEDWHQAFPEFGVYRPMWLLKRNGPVLVGICLERTSSNDLYRPRVHIHNLLTEFDTISLSMSFRLFDRIGYGGLSITTRDHESKFMTAVEKVKAQTRIPLERSLSLDQLIAAIELFVGSIDGRMEGPAHYWTDIITLLTWCGRSDVVQQRLTVYENKSFDLDPRVFVHFGGRERFIEKLHSVSKSRASMSQIVEQEIAKFRIEKIPNHGLICY